MAKKTKPAEGETPETQQSVADVILAKYPVLANPSTVVYESKGGAVSSCSASFFKQYMSRPMSTGKLGTPRSDDRYNNITVLYVTDANGTICDASGKPI
jgi:hypothetical protein